jgi:hypothetical protein
MWLVRLELYILALRINLNMLEAKPGLFIISFEMFFALKYLFVHVIVHHCPQYLFIISRSKTADWTDESL